MTVVIRRCVGTAAFVAFAIAIAFIPGQARAVDAATVVQFTLANGLDVVVIPDHRAAVVTHMLWYRVGGADDPPGKSGVAHALEHMMFKGTRRFGPGVFSASVARHGGSENAFTTPDVTAYHQTVASDRLEMVMEMEADRMRDLVLESAAFESERLVILEERRGRSESTPGGILREQVAAAQYLNHPYRLPVIGWAHEIRAITIDDLRKFYETYYWPNNALLVVAGDHTADSVRALAEKYYGALPRGPEIVRSRTQEPPQVAPRRLEYHDTRVGQPSVQRSYLAPSSTAGEKEHSLPLLLLSDILGGGGTSRLYRELVSEKKIATSAGASYSGASLDLTQFYVYVSPAQGTDLDTAEAAMDRVIAVIRENDVTDDELTRAKKNLLASTIYARDSVTGSARLYGRVLTQGRTITDIQEFSSRVSAVTADDVKRAAQHVFDLRRSVTGRLLKGES
ncbi:MAG: insulinase family protein [Alphaproteobacteria bacterium]|nr:insulinase family protein [Alphaproteobacteria bacterium]